MSAAHGVSVKRAVVSPASAGEAAMAVGSRTTSVCAVRKPAKTEMMHQLHVLRAVAVLLVVINHSFLALSEHRPINHIWIELGWLCGFQGVTIFFVISGFIMVHTTRGLAAGADPALGFFYRRIIRIVPLYYLATALVIATWCLSSQYFNHVPATSYLLLSLLFVPVISSRNLMQPPLSQGWTLNFEMYFYTLFAASLLLPPRVRVWILASVLGASMLLSGLIGGDVEGVAAAFRFLSSPMIMTFAVGMILAHFYSRRPPMGHPWRYVLLSTAIVCLTMIQAAARDADGDGLTWQTSLLCYGTAVTCCWLCTRRNEILPSTGIKGLLSRIATLLGSASYSIYLFHLFAISAVIRVLAPTGFSTTLIIGVCIAASICASTAVHLFVERPITAFLQHRRPAKLALALKL